MIYQVLVYDLSFAVYDLPGLADDLRTPPILLK